MTRYNVVIFGGASGFGKQLVDLIEKRSNSKIFVFGVNKPLNVSKNINFFKCDLTSFSDISKTLKFIIKKLKKIDICIFNSGRIYLSKKFVGDYEKTFLVNFLSQFLILSILVNIKKLLPKKVILISSHVVFKNNFKINDFQSIKSYNFWKSYKNSKFLIYSSFSSLYKKNKKLKFIIFDPGRINTNFGTNIFLLGPVFKLYNNLFGSNPTNIALRLFNFLRKKKNKKGYFKLLDRNGISSKKLIIKDEYEIFIAANKLLKKLIIQLKLEGLLNFK
tara:strand:- start:2291 stop:3118 length:828 start_codon:yes stop_codon:yes gene_type:complete